MFCFNTFLPFFVHFSCLAGFFGAQCLYTPSVLQCTNSNPCVNTLDCGLNGTQAICYCADGMYGCSDAGVVYGCGSAAR